MASKTSFEPQADLLEPAQAVVGRRVAGAGVATRARASFQRHLRAIMNLQTSYHGGQPQRCHQGPASSATSES